METTIILIISILILIISSAILVIAWKLNKKKQQEKPVTLDNLTELLQEVDSRNRDIIETAHKNTCNNINDSFSRINTSSQNMVSNHMETFLKQINEIGLRIDGQMKENREEMSNGTQLINKNIADNLEKMRQDNGKKLEEMRQTVDEKLSETLQKRVNESFEMVQKSLEKMQEGFGEVRDLTGKVGSLNKIFNNVKTRGTWGEVALKSLLEQIMAPDQYCTQFNIKAKELVDFAIIMPGQASEEKVYLPIDAKFPTSAYERLVNASDEGDIASIATAHKELMASIRKEARSISTKYIVPPKTTPFAVMYLPTEGLYAEVVKEPGLCQELQNNLKITICGPSTISALLTSLQTGFTTLKIQKKSGEIVNLMEGFKKEFAKFTEMVEKARENASKTVTQLDDLDRKNKTIQTKLSKIDTTSIAIDTESNKVG